MAQKRSSVVADTAKVVAVNAKNELREWGNEASEKPIRALGKGIVVLAACACVIDALTNGE